MPSFGLGSRRKVPGIVTRRIAHQYLFGGYTPTNKWRAAEQLNPATEIGFVYVVSSVTATNNANGSIVDSSMPSVTITDKASVGLVNHRLNQFVYLFENSSYNVSVYIRALSSRKWVNFGVIHIGSQLVRCYFNLQTGEIGSSEGSLAGNPSNILNEDAGGGWRRISFGFPEGANEALLLPTCMVILGAVSDGSYDQQGVEGEPMYEFCNPSITPGLTLRPWQDYRIKRSNDPAYPFGPSTFARNWSDPQRAQFWNLYFLSVTGSGATAADRLNSEGLNLRGSSYANKGPVETSPFHILGEAKDVSVMLTVKLEGTSGTLYTIFGKNLFGGSVTSACRLSYSASGLLKISVKVSAAGSFTDSSTIAVPTSGHVPLYLEYSESEVLFRLIRVDTGDSVTVSAVGIGSSSEATWVGVGTETNASIVNNTTISTLFIYSRRLSALERLRNRRICQRKLSTYRSVTVL